MPPWLAVFVVAAAVRSAFLFSWMVPPERILTGQHGEVAATARTLVSTGRYADPYIIPTGPTAHPLPIHTALQALLFLVLGETTAGCYARSLAGIASCAAFYALLSLHGTTDVLGFLWNEALAGIALTLLAALFLGRWTCPGGPSRAASFGLGVFAGVSFHLAPALLPVILGYLLFGLLRSRAPGRWAGVFLLVCGASLACLPWGWRNYAALLIPLAAYPLVSYVVAYIPRYNFPLTGLLLMLASSEAVAWRRERSGPG